MFRTACIVIASLLLPATAARSATIGVNLVGGGASLSSTDSTGVVAQSNWNNGTLRESSIASGSVKDSTGATVTGMSVSWGDEYNNNSSALSSSASDSTLPGKLFDGFIAKWTDSDAGEEFIKVSGVPSAVSTAKYDLYIYLAASSTPSPMVARVRLYSGTGPLAYSDIISASGTYAKVTNVATDYDTFTQATGTNAGNATVGNYIKFSNVDFSSFQLRLNATQNGSSGNRVGFAGVQLVPVPEPASLGGLALATLVLTRRRR